jgi:hypothetical protein
VFAQDRDELFAERPCTVSLHAALDRQNASGGISRDLELMQASYQPSAVKL